MKYSRTNYFVKGSLQGEMIGTMLLMILLVSVITFCNIYVIGLYFFRNASQLGISIKETLAFNEIMWKFMDIFSWRLGFIIFIDLFVVGLLTLFISHQIAGPLYKIEKSLDKVSDGDLTVDIVLRKDDKLKELASQLSTIIKNFNQAIFEINSNSELLLKDLESKKTNNSKEKVNNILKITKSFQLEKDTNIEIISSETENPEKKEETPKV